LMFGRDSRKLFGQVGNVVGGRRPLFSTHSQTPISGGNRLGLGREP
jgi:hypothetical protein